MLCVWGGLLHGSKGSSTNSLPFHLHMGLVEHAPLRPPLSALCSLRGRSPWERSLKSYSLSWMVRAWDRSLRPAAEYHHPQIGQEKEAETAGPMPMDKCLVVCKPNYIFSVPYILRM